jgi:hypothetical protein
MDPLVAPLSERIIRFSREPNCTALQRFCSMNHPLSNHNPNPMTPIINANPNLINPQLGRFIGMEILNSRPHPNNPAVLDCQNHHVTRVLDKSR